MTKYLHIICDAGLSNRLHAIVGAQHIAKETGRELIIHWPVNRECGSAFKRLFQNPMEGGRPRYRFARLADVLALMSTRTTVKVYNCGFHNTPTETTECYHINPLDQQEHVLIKSWYVPQLTSQWPTDIAPILATVKQFEPVAEVINLLPAHFIRSCGTLLGMHVRYGDRDESGKWTRDTVRAYGVSRVEDFEHALSRIEDVLPGRCNVFVTSQNLDVEKRLCEHPSQMAVRREKTDARDSVQGMREAVADLWTLAQCKIVLGSYWSQYSQLAAELAGVKLIQVGTKGWELELEAQLAKLAA